MSRRVVVCRIDAKLSNPEEREFDFDCVEDVRKERASLVVDAITVLRAYVAAGRPVRVSSYGSFEDWGLVRGALLWLGEADPVDTRERASAENPFIEEKAELLTALLQHIGTNIKFTIAELDRSHAWEELREILGRFTDRGMWNKAAVGRLLLLHRDVPFMGVELKSRLNARKVQSWWVTGEGRALLTEEEAPIPF